MHNHKTRSPVQIRVIVGRGRDRRLSVITEWRWREWLLALEVYLCEITLKRRYDDIVEQIAEERKGGEARRWLEREWVKHAILRLREDKKVALSRLEAAARRLHLDFPEAMRQNPDALLIERKWNDAVTGTEAMWEDMIRSVPITEAESDEDIQGLLSRKVGEHEAGESTALKWDEYFSNLVGKTGSIDTRSQVKQKYLASFPQGAIR